MAPSENDRAYATVHGFQFRTETAGKNIGCLKDSSKYEIKLMQNSSSSGNMIHESQTDTLSVDLGYITNTGNYDNLYFLYRDPI